jgi:peptidoglycan hydrolase-like protein with peptidoglycan-binding domain
VTKPAPATTTTTATTRPASTPIRLPASTLKPGDRGAQVKILQRALKRLGYPPGAIDGVYGPSTQRALASFQRAAKLTADGILGPKTLAALAQAVSASG